MATAEELLSTVVDSSHKHTLIDNDVYFVIDPNTRVITNNAIRELYLMQYDHRSERFTFELPRYVEGHDMMECTSVKVHFNNIDSATHEEHADVAEMLDLQVNPSNPANVISTWEITRQATQFAGILSFLVQYLCKNEDGEVVYEWHTDIFSNVTVKSGRNNGPAAIIEYTNILEQWEQRLFGGETEGGDSSGSTDPSKIIFPDGLYTTYKIGKVELTNGMGTLVEPGGSLTDFFNVFVDEQNPSTTQPSVSLSFPEAKSYEVGTKVTPSYSASFTSGSYTYGPPTDIVVKAWEITDTANNTSTSSSGKFGELQVVDDTNYRITAKATYDDGSIPVTNIGNEYPSGQIKAGSKSATSSAITGYRKSFYGTTSNKNELSSDIIRSLSGASSKSLANGSSFTVNIPLNAVRIVIAYPSTLRDMTSVKDANFANSEIVGGFKLSTIKVEGANSYDAIDYKVYTLEYAEPNDTVNNYIVTI